MSAPLSDQDWLILCLIGGRSSGKSHAMAQAVILWMLASDDAFVIGFFRQFHKSHTTSVKQLLEYKIREHGLIDYFDICRDKIVCKTNKAVCRFWGMQTHTLSDIKSSERVAVSVVEEAQYVTQEAIDVFENTVVRVKDTKIIYLMNPRLPTTPSHVHLIINTPARTKIVNSSYKDNYFLSDTAVDYINDLKRRDLAKYRQEYMGGFLLEDVDSVFKRCDIDQNRVNKLPDLKRTIISVDPAFTNTADEYGIIVMAMGNDRHVYIIEDASNKYKANDASKKIITLYKKYDADTVIVEKQGGGFSLQEMIKINDMYVKTHLVNATGKKKARADTVSVHYARGECHHYGILGKLEDQQCTWVDSSKYSPDRMDALVHGVRYLYKIGNSVTKFEWI